MARRGRQRDRDRREAERRTGHRPASADPARHRQRRPCHHRRGSWSWSQGDDTLLVENFNDGNADGWVKPAQDGADVIDHRHAGRVRPAGRAGRRRKRGARHRRWRRPRSSCSIPNLGAPDGYKVPEYSIVFDILVPADHGATRRCSSSTSNNNDDGDFFIKDLGNGVRRHRHQRQLPRAASNTARGSASASPSPTMATAR